MRVLKVIHGYPPLYNAGSEVYSQTLCRALAARHEVHVFTREEDPFRPDDAFRSGFDPGDRRVTLHFVNVYRGRDRYRHAGIDQNFAEVLDMVRPDVVHVGHLSHLSTTLVKEAAAREIPVVFTLHDYWLQCPRGQFVQAFPENPEDVWALCDGQDDRKCAERCYQRSFSGAADERPEDMAYWSSWVGRRMKNVREMVELVDTFITPSRHLHDRFKADFGVSTAKLALLPYGFDLERLGGRRRVAGEPFTFGYIGTHTPPKGIDQLLRAFGRLSTEARLRIWGRPRDGTPALEAVALALPREQAARVEWCGEYRNEEIVREVFDRADAVIVPSIWLENSPLVIHEALQARVPVITADAGGMAELVRHEENGLVFRHRDPLSLSEQMRRLAGDPVLAQKLGRRGYLSATGDVPSIEDHVQKIEGIYNAALARRDGCRIPTGAGPWRITLDTNPDDCNLKCIMCEGFSPFSTRQKERAAAGLARRHMPVELIRRVIEDAVPLGLREVIPSTMGEPLLYEHFDVIVELCVKHRLKLNLTTNGTFPVRGAREWAELVVPIGSDVKISWNGATRATQEKIMVGAQWDRVLENVKTFIEVRDAHAAAGGNRCRVTFQLTFLETNVAELAEIVRLAARLGVDRVKGHHLWAHFEEVKALSMRRDPQAITRWNAAVLAAREVAEATPLPNGKPVLLENIFTLDGAASTDLAPGAPCPFLAREAWVSAEGRFDPCCAPDELRRTLGEFGDLNKIGLGEVWSGESYTQLVKTYRTRSLCLGCNMRKPGGAS